MTKIEDKVFLLIQERTNEPPAGALHCVFFSEISQTQPISGKKWITKLQQSKKKEFSRNHHV